MQLKRSKLTLQDCIDVAKERRGRCLSKIYKNNQTKLTWQCEKGHVWEANFHNIKDKKQWCPKCSFIETSKRRKITIEHCKILAKKYNGKCLSDYCTGSQNLLKWQCEHGHIWKTSYYLIKKGSWCPVCAGTTITLEQCQQLAKERNGKCLSDTYINSKTKLIWQCSKGHIFKKEYSKVKSDKVFCRECLKDIQRKNFLNQCKIIAEQKGGRCLSDEYIGIYSKMKWQCKEGHEWKANFHNIKNGRWCPKCKYSKNEQKVRDIFEKLTGYKFPSCRPDFLKNPSTGRNLELDGYCEDLKMAFEYDGEQHYIENGRIFKDVKDTQQRDKLKDRLYKINNIELIRIPYWEQNNLEAFIDSKLKDTI